MTITTKIILEQFAINGRGDRVCSKSTEFNSFDEAINADKDPGYPEFQIIESVQGDGFLDVFDDATGDTVIFDSKN